MTISQSDDEVWAAADVPGQMRKARGDQPGVQAEATIFEFANERPWILGFFVGFGVECVKRRYAEEVLKCFRERNHRPEGMLCNVLFKLASSIRKLIVNLIVARQNEMLMCPEQGLWMASSKLNYACWTVWQYVRISECEIKYNRLKHNMYAYDVRCYSKLSA